MRLQHTALACGAASSPRPSFTGVRSRSAPREKKNGHRSRSGGHSGTSSAQSRPDVLLSHVYPVSSAWRLAASWTPSLPGEANVTVSAVNTFLRHPPARSAPCAGRAAYSPARWGCSRWLPGRRWRRRRLNAVNHAAPRTVEVGVEHGARTLTLLVVDDGTGIPPGALDAAAAGEHLGSRACGTGATGRAVPWSSRASRTGERRSR